MKECESVTTNTYEIPEWPYKDEYVRIHYYPRLNGEQKWVASCAGITGDGSEQCCHGMTPGEAMKKLLEWRQNV